MSRRLPFHPARRRRVGPALVPLIVAVLVALFPTAAGADERPTLAPDEARSVASQAAGWLSHDGLAPDGAAHTSNGRIDPASTAWAALGLHAAGLDAEAAAPTQWLEGHLESLARDGQVDSPGGLALLILVARAADRPAENFGGQDLVGRLLATRGPDGLFGPATSPGLVGDPVTGGIAARQAQVLTALAATGRTDAVAAQWLEQRQCPSGGWQYGRTDPSAPCDPDAVTTGFVLQGLAAIGRAVPAQAVDALARLQTPSGGFALIGGVPDALSTAVAIQGLIAAGQDPNTDRWRRGSGAESATPFLAMLRFDTDRSGGFSPVPNTPPDVAVTSRVLPGASGQTLPLASPSNSIQAETGNGSDDSASSGSLNPAGSSDGFSPLVLVLLAAGAAAVVAVVYVVRRRRQAL